MRKKIAVLTSFVLTFVLAIVGVFSINYSNRGNNQLVRSVELQANQINSDNCYNEFDYYEYDLNEGILEFEGYNTFSLSELYDLDLVADSEIANTQITTKYLANYDYENGIVSLSIAFVNGDQTEIIDTMYGVMCMNDNQEFDVSFDVEGEIVYLSEFSDVEVIENCGFFKNLFNKVKNKVVSTVKNVVDTTKKVLNTNAGKIGTILTVGACAVAGAVCAVVPGCQIGTAVFVGMAIGYVGAATTAAVSTYQQDGQVDWNAVSTYGSMGAVVGGAVAGISYAATSVATGGCVFHCFIEGTLVTTNLGYKQIEDIKVGDYVLSTNVENNTTEYKKVTRLFRNKTTEWVHTVINGEEILSTTGHPYYVQDQGWVRAKNLKIGDVLIDSNNKKVLVENVYIEKLTSPEVTYNFEVEDFHTYYVGENSILVHNKCSGIDYNMSTGRTTPNSLSEKLTMDEIKSNPSQGKIIMENLKDTRLNSDCVKMSYIRTTSEGKVEIHYIWDKAKDVFFDFKFK